MRKAVIKEVLFLVGFWTFCVVFIALYERALLDFEDALTASDNFARDLLIVVLVTGLSGIVVATCDVVVLSRLMRKRAFGVTLLARTAFYLCCIFVFTSMAAVLLYADENTLAMSDAAVWDWFSAYLKSPRVLMIFAYWGLAVLSGLFILMVSEKFGQGVLVDFILGKYHRPREETRIFMFLDLRSSTTYAERLGHIKYSRLIQDCFFDLTDVVTRHRAAIYQYVGDEAVLTWRLKDGLDQGNCINMFYGFDKAIQRRRAHYEREYGMVPEFKAGLHAGLVTAAEVGEIKKELAYHGDVLNTAARIQGTCNEFGTRILLSEALKDLLRSANTFEFSLAGEVLLRGKAKPVKVYSVSRPETND